MKISIKILATSLLLCLLAISARATVIFQDNFNYPGGSTLTNSTWVAGAGNLLPPGIITVTSTNSITIGYGATTSSQPRAYFTNGLANFIITNKIYTGVTNNFINNGTNAYDFPSNAPMAALYFSFSMTIAGSGLTGNYFAYLCDTNFEFNARIFTTNGPGGSGYQLGIQDSSSFLTTNLNGALALNPVVMNANQSYNVVVRYVLATGLSTLWINPTSESAPTNVTSTTANSLSVTGPNFTATQPGLAAIGFRNSSGLGQITVGNLVVGTTFADVVPSSAGLNPPFIVVQPQPDPSGYIGAPNAIFNVVAGGDMPLTYQWFQNTNIQLSDQSGVGAIIGSVSNVLTLTNLTLAQQGTYDCVVSNSVGTNVSFYAPLTVYTTSFGPSITNQPVSSVNTLGDTVSFSVGVFAIPLPTYQWFYVTNALPTPKTNAVAALNVTGTNTGTLTFTQVTTNQAGFYFCTISNSVGVTNSALVQLTVNQPQFVSISSLRTMINASYQPTNLISLFTIQGIVTSWTNMTSAGNTSFYMQDSSAGINVFWSGAVASTNRPPAGALVKVTGPLSSFDGLLEIEPVFTNKQQSVTVISTGNPLPTPQPLPFDPNIVNNTAQMYALGGSYFVVSNVTLSAAPTFVANVNEPVTDNASNVLTAPMFSLTFTNAQGESFVLYVNQYTDIPNTVQPSGPVTMYGVLGYFMGGGSVGPGGWEFTPTRLADIITYTRQTNVLSLKRLGDVPTNSYPQSVLRNGDSITTYLSISDPVGGNVTLTPSTVGLPGDASWSNISAPGQATGKATFTFNPTPADDGSNYVVSLGVSSTSGNIFTNTFSVYVPTPQEQQIYISEIFANPTTNKLSPAYNPLKRPSDFGTETNIPVVDQYVEIANLYPAAPSNNLAAYYLGNASTLLDQIGLGNASGYVLSSNAYLVYGGPPNGDSSAPTILGGYNANGYIEPIGPGESLGLSTNGGIVTLYNANTNLIDRLVYPATSLNSSYSRFPTMNSGLVAQQYISTNYTTAGLQYDGSPWTSPTKVPVGITGVTLTGQGGTNVIFKFPVNTYQAYTIWGTSNLLTPAFNVIYGQGPLPNLGNDSITNPISGPDQFYFMTTQ